MNISSKLDQLHADVKGNRWHWFFAICARVLLAAGFLPSGFVKIMGERFTDLSNNHPMGHYLEALYHTGYYYTFIGVVQVTVAILLLFPRTALLGTVLYFPIILNICILSFSVRFDGSLLSSPLMVLANLYLLGWYYDRIKLIFPFKQSVILESVPKVERKDTKFPFVFFSFSFLTIVILVLVVIGAFHLKPYNTLSDCKTQCKNDENPQACLIFCEQIHTEGKPLNKSIDEYNKN